MFDLVIRDALLLDGLGSAPLRGDLAVTADRIAALGKVEGPSKKTIEAGGLALMPGIVDNHTHYDAQITWDPGVTPSPELGVTTAVIGNCGFTIAPCRSGDRELVMRNLTQVEGMSLEVLRQGIRWDFETVPEYLDMLERQRAAVNVAVFAGHSALRTYVMGEAATRRAATGDEIQRMKELLLEAMRAGAIGFSTSTSPAHNGEGGLPMPSRLAGDDELRTLVTSLKEAGRGLFMLTKGGHTRMAFLEELAAESTRPVVVAALLHSSANPDAVFRDLDAIAQANARGRRLVGAVSCCPLAMDFTLRSPYTFEGLESWQPALALKGAAYEAKLRKALPGRGARRAGAAGALSPVQRPVGQSARDRVRAPGRRAARGGRAGARGRSRPARLHARPRARRKPANRIQRPAPQLRRGSRRPDAAPSGEPGVAFRRRSPSSTMPASACISLATGYGSAAR
jgi:N-acyl-D-amino-acid deacylase